MNEKWKACGKQQESDAIKTMAETAIATIGAAAVLSAVEWPVVLSATILSGILSLLVSIKGLPEVEKETANKN